MHVNNLGTFPSGDPAELAGLSDADQGRLTLMTAWGRDMTGYAIVQATRPRTIAYALTDSPVGQLAWIVEKFKEWTDPAAKLPDDAHTEPLPRATPASRLNNIEEPQDHMRGFAAFRPLLSVTEIAGVLGPRPCR